MSTIFGSDIVLGIITWALSFFLIPWVCVSMYISKKIYIQYKVEPPLAARVCMIIVLIMLYFTFFGQLIRPITPICNQEILRNSDIAMGTGGICGIFSYILLARYSLHLKKKKKKKKTLS
jgi:hypothetical protein